MRVLDGDPGDEGERRTVMVRSLDWDLWVKLRSAAVRRRTTTAAVLEEILAAHFAVQDAPAEVA
jgi:hypothetical protein